MSVPILNLLTSGELTVLGRISTASNLTVACDVSDGDTTMRCVYKPIRGEEPLWDFPEGTLAGREVASYLVSEALGWQLIPETAMRPEGPADIDLGPGMVQRWIHEPESSDETLDTVDVVPGNTVPAGYCGVLSAYDHRGDEVLLVHRDSDDLRRLAVLDAVLNNADRKGGHILTADDGRLYGIDHGICLHRENKLRTILWGWAGQRVPTAEAADLRRLAGELDDDTSEIHQRLSELISGDEIAALSRRAKVLGDDGVMPLPPGNRAIPWPPF
ncbi:MAG: SCO1664 family protein [Gordonia sp. (in: high G+C Gram-positive bacteria)]|uniref:SCO1664 family protein n=1 Tax=Gordonia sp. (in: high G+C Gram-positive bacteria) TaxID=84139 RepID=UPI003C779EDA